MSEYTEYIQEVFREFGDVSVRKMFGGYGVYHEGLMFALLDDDELFMKVDAENKLMYEQRSLPAFKFARKDKIISMSYHKAPDEMMDDSEMAAAWARESWRAAERTKKK